MTQAYVITEGKLDAEILQRILSTMKGIEWVVGDGKYSAHSLATSILIAKQKPVALMVDADTDVASSIQEERDFLQDSLRRVASGIPFKILIAVPEIETIFFHDQAIFERVTGQKFTDREWENLKRHPKDWFRSLSTEYSTSIRQILDKLTDDDVRILREHPLLAELWVFLASVVGEKSPL